MREVIEELADYRAGVPESTEKCSREQGLEGWLKGKKAIISTRIELHKRLNYLRGF